MNDIEKVAELRDRLSGMSSEFADHFRIAMSLFAEGENADAAIGACFAKIRTEGGERKRKGAS